MSTVFATAITRRASLLLAAPSIAYSASASGTYYESELLKKRGLEPAGKR